MVDKPELQNIFRPDNALVHSETRSSLIVRGSTDAKSLLAREPKPLFRAKVKLNGKWGLIDKTGRFAVEPFCCEIRGFSCGMAAFSDVPSDDHGAGRWGFVSEKWRVAIPARFKQARDFSEDLAGVAHDGKWGFLSKDGSFAIEPRFDAVGDFSEGLCIAKKDKKYGFLDHSGKFVVKPSFSYLWGFSEGLARVEIDSKYGFIDREGEIVIPPVFDLAEDFYGGAAFVEFKSRSCLIDRKGTVVFTCTEEKEGDCVFSKEQMGDFFDGVALVAGHYYARASDCGHDVQNCDGVCNDEPCTCPASKMICRECKWDIGYYIDRAGKPIPMPEGIVGIGHFSEGLGLVGCPKSMHPVGTTTYSYGYIDNQGSVKIAPQFKSAGHFVDGVALVFTEQEEWRLIDKSGNLLNMPQSQDTFHRIHGFTRSGGPKWETEFGFADALGGVVVEPIYLDQDFCKGIARVYTTGGQWRFVHKLGIFVDITGLETSYSFREDVNVIEGAPIRFKAGGKYGFADQVGNVLVAPQFPWADRFANGMARFRCSELSNSKWGFIDTTGETAIPPQFDFAENFEALAP